MSMKILPCTRIGNVVTINNKLIVKQNSISFTQCHGAMLQCWFGEFDFVKLNNTEDTINQIDSNGDTTVISPSVIDLSENRVQLCSKAEMYGKNYYISQKMIKDKPANGSDPRVLCTYYDNRLKIYFQPVITSSAQLSGETPEQFNNGDVICVTAKRTIAIS